MDWLCLNHMQIVVILQKISRFFGERKSSFNELAGPEVQSRKGTESNDCSAI